MDEPIFDYQGVVPAAVGEEAEWFELCRGRRLMIQKCDACGHYQFPPRSVCVECLDAGTEWVEAAGTGRVFTYTVQHRDAPGFSGQAPYTIAMVELDEGPRLMSRVVDTEDVQIDMTVEVRWATIADDFVVPVFVGVDASVDAR
jgi:uncharacterized OB-fold protein